MLLPSYALAGAWNLPRGEGYQLLRREGLAVSVQGSYIVGGGPPESILDLGSRNDSFELRGLWGQSKEFAHYVLFFDAQAAIRARNTNVF